MNTPTKRKEVMEYNKTAKRSKTECPYGDKCFRLNPIHFKEYSHEHLESILDSYTGSGDFPIPSKLVVQKQMYIDQLKMIIHKQLYKPGKNFEDEQSCSTSSVTKEDNTSKPEQSTEDRNKADKSRLEIKKREKSKSPNNRNGEGNKLPTSRSGEGSKTSESRSGETSRASSSGREQKKDSDYRPIVQPTRRVEDFLSVVRPKGKMAAKHAASAPYHIFYTTITDCKETHAQPYSITFQATSRAVVGK